MDLPDLRIIVCGGRFFEDYDLLCRVLDYYLSNVGNRTIEIVCGGAPGADKLGDDYAKAKGVPVKYFFADWVRKGPAAGPMRNEEMAKYATHCIAFWDGKGKGTGNMIGLAKQYELCLKVIPYQINP